MALHVILSLDNPVSLRDFRRFVYLTESKKNLDEDLRYLDGETGRAELLEATLSDTGSTVHLYGDILELRRDGQTFRREDSSEPNPENDDHKS